MKLHWRYDIDGAGIIYGYAKSGRAIKQALARQGVEFTEDAEVALSYIGADFYNRAGGTGFQPVHTGKDARATNIRPGQGNPAPTGTGYKEYLFTMFEADLLPAKFVDGLRQADSIIAPSRHNADVFKRYANGRPVHVCRLGIDPKIYKFKERSGAPFCKRVAPEPSFNFRFLWLGSKSLRKGWDLMARAFQAEFRPDEPVELFIKTTCGTGFQPVDNTGKDACATIRPEPGEIRLRPKVIYDDRDYTEPELIDLYYSAHAFVFPTRGEGFGLPALEALSTGCLVIAPSVQGLAEFVNNRTALVVNYDWIEADYGLDILSPNCDLTDLRRQMRRAYRDYKIHSRKARAGAEFVQGNLTWDHTASRLIEIIWGQKQCRGGFITRPGQVSNLPLQW